MPTREQLISALRQADAAGDTAAAQRFADLIKAEPVDTAQPADPFEGMSDITRQYLADTSRSGTPVEKRLEIFKKQIAEGVPEHMARVNAVYADVDLMKNIKEDLADAAKFASGIPGAIPTIASSMAAETIAGIGGIVQEAVTRPVGEALGFNMASGADTVGQIREMLTIPPVGERAEATLQDVGEAIEPLAQIRRTAGEAVEGMGGSPVESAFAETAVAAIPELFGLRAFKAAKAKHIEAPSIQAAAKVSDNSVVETARNIGRSTSTETPTKQYIKERLAAGDSDVQFLGKELRGKEIVKNKYIKEAVRQGLDKRVLRSIETANPSTKATMREMLSTLKKRRTDADFGVTNRVTDRIGSNVYKRYNELNNLRRNAGQDLEKAVKGISSEPFDFAPEVGTLFRELKEVGVNVRRKADGKFEADIENIDQVSTAGTDKAIKAIISRINKAQSPTAGDAHRLKKLIDDAVDYGALPTADTKLASGVEAALKRFRHNVNESLAGEFDNYGRANRAYREVIEPLSEMDRVFKSVLKVSGKDALEAGVGTKAARTILSNNVGRAAMLDLLKQADEVLLKNNKKFDDDLIKQAVFADELERLFGSEATTSFTGSTQRATEQAVRAAFGADVIQDVAIKGLEKLRGVNEDNAIKALEAMLGDSTKAKPKP